MLPDRGTSCGHGRRKCLGSRHVQFCSDSVTGHSVYMCFAYKGAALLIAVQSCSWRCLKLCVYVEVSETLRVCVCVWKPASGNVTAHENEMPPVSAQRIRTIQKVRMKHPAHLPRVEAASSSLHRDSDTNICQTAK